MPVRQIYNKRITKLQHTTDSGRRLNVQLVVVVHHGNADHSDAG